MRNLAMLFRGLADETRLAMMGMLLHRTELCVCDFVEVLGVTQSKASRHVRYLLHAGLLDDRREGIWVHYRVSRGLDAEGRLVARTLRRLLGGDRMGDVEKRLAAWLKRKPRLGCVAPRTTCRLRSEGRRGGR